jgi:hypothetical protein
LIGGSSNDNLFQTANVVEELDRVRAFGGNYVRNTMSSRDPGDLHAFYRDPQTGQYDLSRWNDEYWNRLRLFLDATRDDRDIIVQLEIWATYDFYTRPAHDIDGVTAWGRNRFNPANNINYAERESGLYETFRSTHGTLINPFFKTVLPLRQPFDFQTRTVLLEVQHQFVDKLLSHTLDHDHVLFVIDNETNTDPLWPKYWSQYIRKQAAERGLTIEVTEMWDTFDPTDGAVPDARLQNPATHFFARRATVSNTLNDPENYSYIEISNHNVQVGEVHFKTGNYIWNEVQRSGIIRPINNTKIYGSDQVEWTGSDRDGKERFWRNIFAGLASVRFHRPPGGLGHTEAAMAHVRSMRMFADAVDITRLVPRTDLLSDWAENEAYCLAEPGSTYAVVFMDGRQVRLDASALNRSRVRVRWLNIEENRWREARVNRGNDGTVSLRTPGSGFWLALVTGTLLVPGRRTVTAALRVLGLDASPRFQNYHRVLSRARWSARHAAQVLLRQLVETFAPEGPLVFALDDTIERRWGRRIKARGIYRDPVRGSHGHFVKASGLRWLSLMLLAPVPWAGRVWALPFLTALCSAERYARENGKRHKTLLDWARQMVLQLRRWLPERTLILVGDNAYAALEWLDSVRRHATLIPRSPTESGPAPRTDNEPDYDAFSDEGVFTSLTLSWYTEA